MPAMAQNPFERFDLDIAATLPELTRTLRERIEDAGSEEERQQLREVWESLTGKLETRADLVLSVLPRHARPLRPAPTPEPPPAPRAHPLDTKPLPPFPLDWDRIGKTKSVEAGRIELSDPVFSDLQKVVLP